MPAAYSVWTNYSYKLPILAGACTCLLSNMLYVFSYDARALWMLVLSRFVMGFGVIHLHVLKHKQDLHS